MNYTSTLRSYIVPTAAVRASTVVMFCHTSWFNTVKSKWMNTYPTNRTQSVRTGSAQTPHLTCSIGVSQESILGPILFSCPSVNVQMYADDTVLYVHAKSKKQATNKLTAAMVNVSDWLKFIFTP